MYVNIIDEKKTGRQYMIVRESFRKDGKISQRTIAKIGYVDEFIDCYEDPIAHFKEFYKKETERLKAQKKQVNIFFSPAERLNKVTLKNQKNTRKCFGTSAISIIFNKLELDKFVNKHLLEKNDKFEANAIMKFLIYCRLLYSESNQSLMEKRLMFFEKMDFLSSDIYYFFNRLIKNKQILITHLNSQIEEKDSRNKTLLFYFLAQTCFEIKKNNLDYSIKSDLNSYEIDDIPNNKINNLLKPKRSNLKIKIGLLLDENFLPISYKIYKNKAEYYKTYESLINENEINLECSNTIIVSDEKMINEDSILNIVNEENGYILGYSISNLSQSFKEYIFDQNDYEYIDMTDKKLINQLKNMQNEVENGINGIYRIKIKSKIVQRIIEVSTDNPFIKDEIEIQERQIVLCYERYNNDEEKHIKERCFLEEPEQLNIINKETKNKSKNKNEDEISLLKELSSEFKHEFKKIVQNETKNAYFVLCTNVSGLNKNEKAFEGESRFTEKGFLQLNKVITPYDIIKIYAELKEVNGTFKVSKNTLELMPISQRTELNLGVNFIISYVSLIIIKQLEKSLEYKYSKDEIINSLRRSKGSQLEENYYLFDYNDAILNELDLKLGTEFSYKYRTLEQIIKYFNKTT